jgi:hypothetical protein
VDGQNVAGQPLLHHLTVFHDCNEVANLLGHPEIVGNEDDGETESLSPGCRVRPASYGCVLPANAFSITSPIGCHTVPSNWTRRICLMGWKSVGPVLNVMFGSASEFR